MSSDPSLELVAALSQINQYSLHNTCNYILGGRYNECGGGEANPVNCQQLGCWVIKEASRVVNLFFHLRSNLKGRGETGSWIFRGYALVHVYVY